jgi:hypothetical protein
LSLKHLSISISSLPPFKGMSLTWLLSMFNSSKIIIYFIFKAHIHCFPKYKITNFSLIWPVWICFNETISFYGVNWILHKLVDLSCNNVTAWLSRDKTETANAEKSCLFLS